MKVVQNLYRELNQWEGFLRRNRAPVLVVSYEELDRSVAESVIRICRFGLGFEPDPSEISADFVKISNTADAENTPKIIDFVDAV